MTLNKNYEKELPIDFSQVCYINAKNTKTGIIFNLIALLTIFIVGLLSYLLLHYTKTFSFSFKLLSNIKFSGYMFLFLIFMLIYTVLHEIVHGIFYKIFTKEKLTFGVSWSCAYCGIPNIYTYRKTAIISTLAPFIIFSIIFIALFITFYFISTAMCFIFTLLFGYHLGGCAGDLYVFYILAIKFKGKAILMRDTGPEQFFYIKNY